jgi:phosphopantetheinyl transferase (holo-ACP synthase)
MIIGIGTDILNLERINKIIDKYDQKFIDRIYGKNEIQF